MRPIDFAKAAGVAIAVLVLNVLIAILVVLGYAIFIEPGHPSEFYDVAALAGAFLATRSKKNAA